MAYSCPFLIGINDMSKVLSVVDHSRSFKNFSYVYPVLSRRSNGISLGINLNLNNACNWRCVYCQVEGLVRGKPNSIDLVKLEFELEQMLDWIVNGDFVHEFAPLGLQRFNDICLSGNGEPTLSVNFAAVCAIIAKLRLKFRLREQVKTILITNGSEVHKSEVQDGLRIIAVSNGEIWFKIDRGSVNGISSVNQVSLSLTSILQRLTTAAEICRTQIQSCWFSTLGIEPDESEVEEFINLLKPVRNIFSGVLLYSTARNPALEEGQDISQVSERFMLDLQVRLQQRGIHASIYI